MFKNQIEVCVRGGVFAVAALSLSACSVNIPAAFSAAWSAASASISQERKVVSPATDASADYRPRLEMARAAFSKGHYGISIDHLNAELAQRPDSVAALNGLGASYDRLSRYDVALNYYFQALELDPVSSITLANIGYSYLLQSRLEDAVAVLQLALQYDATNENAATNLLIAQDNILTIATQTLALQSTEPPPSPVAITENSQTVQPEPRIDVSLRLEVSNGNGVNGMAGRLRNYLVERGLQTPQRAVRLTNADNFAHAQSLLFFRTGHREAAEGLVAVLPLQNIELQETNQLLDSIDLRLLIGRDFLLDYLETAEPQQLISATQ